MSNWLTITWENERMRVLCARVQNKSVVFECAEQFTLQKNDSGNNIENSNELPSVLSIKDQLIQFIQKNRLGKAETLVLLNRSDVEVRSMVFPPVPVDELCDMVRFQAIKEFNAYDQNSPLDFFVTNKFDNISRSALFPVVFNSSSRGGISGSNNAASAETKSSVLGGAPVHLLASTIRRELFQKINKFCEDAGLNLRRILLRPCESAYLWKFSADFSSSRTVLLLELDADETAQAVLFRGEPVFIRSPKISPPADVTNPDFVAILAAELRRTMIAVRNEIQGVTVDDVVICGRDSKFEALSKLLSEMLRMPVKMFDPWTDPKLSNLKLRITRDGLVRMSDKLRGDLSAGNLNHPERYAALIGSTIRAGRNVQSDVDFCNPKKRQERVGYRVLANVAVVLAFLLIIGWIGYEFHLQYSLTKTDKELSAKKYKLEQTKKSVVPLQNQLHEIESWYVDKIDWFEQLAWLSRNAPESRDMMITALTLSVKAGQGGSMNFTSLARNSSIVSPMEEKFRADNHDVKTGEKSEKTGNSQYRYQVTLWIYLAKSDWNLTPIQDEPIVENVGNGDKNSTSIKAETSPLKGSSTTSVLDLPRPVLSPPTTPTTPTPMPTTSTNQLAIPTMPPTTFDSSVLPSANIQPNPNPAALIHEDDEDDIIQPMPPTENMDNYDSDPDSEEYESR
jgi:hypothetical protein